MPPRQIKLIDRHGNVEKNAWPVPKETCGTFVKQDKKQTKKKQIYANSTEECLHAEKTKPWINGFVKTLISLGPNGKENALYYSLINQDKFKGPLFSDIESDSTKLWYEPTELYYKILCGSEQNTYNITYKKFSSPSITRIEKISDQNQNDENVVELQVANILTKNDEEIILRETSEYKTARDAYYQMKLEIDEDQIELFMNKKVTSGLPNSLNIDLRLSMLYKISKFLEAFGEKISKTWLNEFYEEIREKTLERTNRTVKQILHMVVISTIFLRNEFDKLNTNLCGLINRNILTPKNILLMPMDEILPELFQNVEIKIQHLQPKLVNELEKLKDDIVTNLATNILLYNKTKERNKYVRKLSCTFLHPSMQEDSEIIKNDPAYISISDIIPIQYLKTIRQQMSSSDQLSIKELDKLGEFIFYKDEDGKMFCYDLVQIKNFVDQDITINPLSSKKFSDKFLKMIKKLNLKRVFPSGFLAPHTNPTQQQEDIFGSDSDDSESDEQIEESPTQMDVESVEESKDPIKSKTTPTPPCGDKLVSSGVSSEKSEQKIEVVYPNFLNAVQTYLTSLLSNTEHKYSFAQITQKIQDDEVPKHCKYCKKVLQDVSLWTSTVDKTKNGEFEQIDVHLKCLCQN